MLNKLAKAFTKLLAEVRTLEASITNLPIPKDGKPGAPGIAPTAEAVAALVLAKMPTPKDGKPGRDADADAVIKEVLAQIPTPKDGKPGRDAQAPLLADVAALVLAKMPTPKDGISPSLPAVVAEAVKLIPKPKDGVSPSAKSVAALVKVPVPKQGKPGKAGASITDVKLERNVLSVWIDGVKKRVGKIDPPAAPQFAMGGNTVIKETAAAPAPLAGFIAISDADVTLSQDSDAPSFLPGFSLEGTGWALFDGPTGAVENTTDAAQTADGMISFNPNKLSGGGSATVYVFSETSTDGGATFIINEGSLRPVEISNNSDSFTSAVSFVLSTPPGGVVRFRAWAAGAMAFTPSTQSVLGGQTVTGHSMIWNLSKNNG